MSDSALVVGPLPRLDKYSTGGGTRLLVGGPVVEVVTPNVKLYSKSFPVFRFGVVSYVILLVKQIITYISCW